MVERSTTKAWLNHLLRHHPQEASPGAADFLHETVTETTRIHAGHESGILSVAFSPDGHHVISGSLDSTIKLVNLTRGELVRTFEGHHGNIHSVAFSPDGKHFASGALDGTVQLRDADSLEVIRSDRVTEPDNPVTSLCYSADGKWMLVTSFDYFTHRGEANLLNVAGEGRRVMHERIMAHILHGRDRIHAEADQLTSAAFSPDGMWAVAGSLDGSLVLWPLDAIYRIFMRLEPTPGS